MEQKNKPLKGVYYREVNGSVYWYTYIGGENVYCGKGDKGKDIAVYRKKNCENPFLIINKKDVKGLIYFIQCLPPDGPIKIGFTMNSVKSRLRNLRGCCPFELKVISTLEGNTNLEKRLHQRFAKYRIHGEWFRPEEKVLDFIDFIAN